MENNTMHKTIYPHPYQVQKVTPWAPDPNRETGKGAIAGVLLRYGPISIRARLFTGDNGLFLRMPSRKDEKTGEYWDHAFITDRTLVDNLTTMAIQEYHKVTGQVGEIIAA